MNLKTQLLALAALLLTATSCNDNNAPDPSDIDGIDSKKETLVTVRLGSGSVASRAQGAAAEATLAFTGGHMYFTSTQGIITRYYEISATEDTDMEAGILKLSDLQATTGLEIKNVPANSDSIFIIGNVPAVKPDGTTALTVPTTVGGHIRTIQSIEIGVASQNAADGGTGKVTVYGAGKIVDLDTPEPNKKKAEVNVRPQSGRIEITKLTYDGGEITGYDVEAVYINNYYADMRLDSYVIVGDSIHNMDVLANYVAYVGGDGSDKDDETGSVSTNYANTGLYDWHVGSPISAATKVAQPADSKVWAYNVLAPLKSFTGLDTDPIARPHIIVRLNNITTTNDVGGSPQYTTPMYLTMRLKDTDTGKEIAKFTPGNVYKVENIVFKDGNLYSRPEMTVIDVAVKVTLVDWTLKSTGVILN